MAGEFPWIGDIRGLGLMRAIELVSDPVTKEPDEARTSALMEETKDGGLLVGRAGLRNNVIRLGPSLLVTEDEIKDCLHRFREACIRIGG